jgi:hypothetical protein
MWKWMVPGGIFLGAALGGIIAASPHPARTAGDVTAIVVVVVAFSIPWLGMSSENRARRRWASQQGEAASDLAPADVGSTAEPAADPGPTAASWPWLGGKEWTTDGRAQASGYAGVLKSLVDLGYLSEPPPPPTKYYDMTYVERAHESLSRAR